MDAAQHRLLCTRCGTTFICGALVEQAAGEPRCWCMALPALPAPDASRSCYCPACLRELTAAPPG
jgi:hypothetical protein